MKPIETETDRLKALYRKEDRRDTLPAAVLSAAVHSVLGASLFFAMQWNTSNEAVYAELWAPVDISGGMDPEGVAEKLPVDPNPAPDAAPEPEPEPAPEPQTAPPPQPEPGGAHSAMRGA